MFITISQIVEVFCIFLLLNTILQLYLVRRNISVLSVNRDKVPNYFRGKTTFSEYKKGIDYSLVKLNLKQMNIFLDSTFVLLFTIFGGLNFIAYLASVLVQYPGIVRDLVLILLFSFVSYLLSLPLTIYSIFGIETKFGFNYMTPQLFLKDQVKGLVFGGILLVLLGLMVLYFLQFAGHLWWLYAWLFWVGFSLVLSWAYPKWIAPIFNTFKPLEDAELRSRVEQLLQQVGFESNGIFVMDGSKRSGHSNAYFTGFGKNKRIVIYDTLLKDMNAKEIIAILAHELGHFKLRHIPKQLSLTLVSALLVFYLLGVLINEPLFYLGLGVNLERMSYGTGLLLFFLVFPIVVFLLPLNRIISRKNEYEADYFAAKTTSSRDLISALIKLYGTNASSLVTDKWYSFFYDSHPNAKDRIKALEDFR